MLCRISLSAQAGVRPVPKAFASARVQSLTATRVSVGQPARHVVVHAEASGVFALDYSIENEDPRLTANWKPIIKVAISGAAGQVCCKATS